MNGANNKQQQNQKPDNTNMGMRILIGAVIVAAIILIIVLVASDNDVIDNDIDLDNGTDIINDEPEQIDALFDELPHEMTVGERIVAFDATTLPQTERDEYSETSPPLALQMGESPIAYVERYLQGQLTAEHVQDQPEFFDYEVTFHRMDEQEGVSAYVRVMDIPDDSVGGGEDRFDFVLANGAWSIEWYGERVYCRRPDQQFWQPADELCP